MVFSPDRGLMRFLGIGFREIRLLYRFRVLGAGCAGLSGWVWDVEGFGD